MRSELCKADSSESEKASSSAPLFRTCCATSARSQPATRRSGAYLRSARAKEPPIRPVPRMVTRWIKCGDIGRTSLQWTVYSSQSEKEQKYWRGDAGHAKKGSTLTFHCMWRRIEELVEKPRIRHSERSLRSEESLFSWHFDHRVIPRFARNDGDTCSSATC